MRRLLKIALPLLLPLLVSGGVAPIAGCVDLGGPGGSQCATAGQLCDRNASKCCPGLNCLLIPQSDPALSACR